MADGDHVYLAEQNGIDDEIRMDAVHQELSLTDSSLKDLLMDDANGSLFDSISWLLMNSGSLEFSDPPDSNMYMSMKASSDALEHSITSPAARDASLSASDWVPWSQNQNMDHGTPGTQTLPQVSSSSNLGDLQIYDENDDDYEDDDLDLSDPDICSGKAPSRKRQADSSQPLKPGEAPKKKRQRERVDDLEAKVTALLKENAELRAHLTDVSTRSIDMERQKVEMLTAMTERVGQGDVGSPELSQMVKRYSELFAEYGASRQKEMDFHLNQLKKLLLPTPTTKMCLWTLQQDKSFYQSSKSPLWGILSAEIGLSQEQTLKIQTHRQRVLELLEKLQESLALANSLHDSITRKNKVFERCLEGFHSVISPRQAVLFILWVKKYELVLAQILGKQGPKDQSPTRYALAPTRSLSKVDEPKSLPA